MIRRPWGAIVIALSVVLGCGEDGSKGTDVVTSDDVSSPGSDVGDAGTGSDVGDAGTTSSADTPATGSGDATSASDASAADSGSDADSSGADVSEPDVGPMYNEVVVETGLPTTCAELCAAEDLLCDQTYDSLLYGDNIAGFAEWADTSQAIVGCDELPDATYLDPFSGDALQLSAQHCFCAQP